jgi:periplasmic protein TonB
MSNYRGTADRPDQAKAVAAVVAVHVLLAVAILAGLNVRMVSEAVDRLKTFDVREVPPPPVKPPPPARKPQPMKKPAGAPAPRAEPSPIVAPPPKLPLPSPIPAAKIAGTGSASSSGASASGTGTGAGGSGNGAGGGGYGNFSRFTPARLVRNLSRGDYRLIAGGRMPAGAAMVSLLVRPTGLPSNCRIVRSSGDPYVDSGLCPLVVERLRFRPALDDQGRPVPYQLQYVATWRL